MITGKHLISWGFKPDSWFGSAIAEANKMIQRGHSEGDIRTAMEKLRRQNERPQSMMREKPLLFDIFLDAENEGERANKNAVIDHMNGLMRIPVVQAGAVMPDACPAGSTPATIPVGGVIASTEIHPGMHSSDVCCSMAISLFHRGVDPRKLLDAVQMVTHFGPGGRSDIVDVPPNIMGNISLNPFLKDLDDIARSHFATQGDGNHFAYVGYLASTGQIALVTHHGSRGLGAQLYKRGIMAAQKYTALHAPEVPKHNSWIKADSAMGRNYWSALQIVREWTKQSHFAIHQKASALMDFGVSGRFWNEHNFVFQRTDGLFYHAKGSTPSFRGYSGDDSGMTLIPMNCSEPILIAKHSNGEGVRGFAPHGAGRNFSRTTHLKTEGLHQELQELQELQERGLDIRSYCGIPDLSELPSAYKNASAVKAQIAKYDLAEIVDEILSYGSIMAGDWQRDASWRKG
jgi:hypothetical protein